MIDAYANLAKHRAHLDPKKEAVAMHKYGRPACERYAKYVRARQRRIRGQRLDAFMLTLVNVAGGVALVAGAFTFAFALLNWVSACGWPHGVCVTLNDLLP